MEKNVNNKETEEILNLTRDEKISEEEILKESISQKNELIKELEEKNKELTKQILYLKAEFDNYRKRTEKEKRQKFLLGKISIFEKIISLYEMFNLAIKSIENINQPNTETNISQILDGIKLLYKEFENFLDKEGIKKIDCINKPFDHKYHEIVGYKETNEYEPDTIIEVTAEGYILNDTSEEFVLRPSKVVVTKPKKIEKNETKTERSASNQNGST